MSETQNVIKKNPFNEGHNARDLLHLPCCNIPYTLGTADYALFVEGWNNAAVWPVGPARALRVVATGIVLEAKDESSKFYQHPVIAILESVLKGDLSLSENVDLEGELLKLIEQAERIKVKVAQLAKIAADENRH